MGQALLSSHLIPAVIALSEYQRLAKLCSDLNGSEILLFIDMQSTRVNASEPYLNGLIIVFLIQVYHEYSILPQPSELLVNFDAMHNKFLGKAAS